MTANKRIVLNIVATYGRSLYALVLGVFTARWVLMALGEIDYGLFGVIGGMMAFIGFFNVVLGGAVSRFYAYSVGAASSSNSDQALEECRKWFNTALTVHSIAPIILISAGYPLGIWAIRNWLTIPSDRIADCIWVFRFTCVSCFIGMVNVPFAAMYTAKQYIAELTIYSFVTTTCNFLFCGYMVAHPGDWLIRYAAVMCCLAAVPQLLIAWRACIVFPECTFKVKYLGNIVCLKKLGAYAGWQILGTFCGLMRTQGVTILVNKFFGPIVNSAMSIANTVNSQSSTLSSSLLSAFTPAITNACGAKDFTRMKTLTYAASKFGTLLNLLFVIPLMVELPAVMKLWLKEPPAYTVGFCICMLAYHLIDVSTNAHMVVVNASGNVADYQKTLSMISIFTLPITALCLWMGGGPYWVGYILVAAILLNTIGRVYFARRIMGIGASYWLFHVIMPLLIVSFITGVVGFTSRFFMETGFARICVTSGLCLATFLPLSWFYVFDREEKKFVLSRVSERMKYVSFLH